MRGTGKDGGVALQGGVGARLRVHMAVVALRVFGRVLELFTPACRVFLSRGKYVQEDFTAARKGFVWRQKYWVVGVTTKHTLSGGERQRRKQGRLTLIFCFIFVSSTGDTEQADDLKKPETPVEVWDLQLEGLEIPKGKLTAVVGQVRRNIVLIMVVGLLL